MTRTLPIFLALLAGCDTDTGPYCEEVVSPLGLDEESPFGVTGSDLVDSLPESSTGAIVWSGETTDSFAWGFAADLESLRLVESTEVYPEPGPFQSVDDIGIYCPDYVGVDGTLTLQSGDGQLDEAQEILVSISEDEEATGQITIATELDPDALGGTLVLSDYIDESGYDSVSLYLYGNVVDGVFSGELYAQVETVGEDVATAEIIPIATFTAE